MLTKTIYAGAMRLRKWGFDFNETQNPLVQEMQKTIQDLKGIQFDVTIDKETNEWVAESSNIDGIITSGASYPCDFSENTKDAIFTYFEIPPYLCNDALLHSAQHDNVETEERRVYATR